jgi:hypothetical protein
MCVWPNLIAYWAGKPPIRGLNHFERFCRLDRFTVPRTTLPPPGGTESRGGTAVATKELVSTKQRELDDYLNYEVAIPRWRFELMRLGAWFIVFQITFFVFLIIPLVVLRTVTGADSPYIP